MSKSKRMSITLPLNLKTCVEQDAKDLAISEAAVIRMRLKERYDRLAREVRVRPQPTPTPPATP